MGKLSSYSKSSSSIVLKSLEIYLLKREYGMISSTSLLSNSVKECMSITLSWLSLYKPVPLISLLAASLPLLSESTITNGSLSDLLQTILTTPDIPLTPPDGINTSSCLGQIMLSLIKKVLIAFR